MQIKKGALLSVLGGAVCGAWIVSGGALAAAPFDMILGALIGGATGGAIYYTVAYWKKSRFERESQRWRNTTGRIEEPLFAEPSPQHTPSYAPKTEVFSELIGTTVRANRVMRQTNALALSSQTSHLSKSQQGEGEAQEQSPQMQTIWERIWLFFQILRLQISVQISQRWIVFQLWLVFVKEEWFFILARVLPIGGWLQHLTSPSGINALHSAVLEGNVKKVATIIKVLPKEMLYSFIVAKDAFVENAIGEALWQATLDFSETAQEILSSLLMALPLHQRVPCLNTIQGAFFLAKSREEVIRLVMEAIPEQERYTFLDQSDPLWQDTPFMHVCRPKVAECLLQYYPREHLFEYLTRQDLRGQTVLVKSIGNYYGEEGTMTNYLLSLIPETKRLSFLTCHNQGKKAMWLAQAYGQLKVIASLEQCGLPRAAPEIKEEEIKAMAAHWQAIALQDRKDIYKALEEETLPLRAPPTLKEVKAMIAKWMNLSLELREKKMVVLEQYGIPIPISLIRLDTMKTQWERWSLEARLEEVGVPVSQDDTLEDLRARLASVRKEKEFGENAMTAFLELFGVHPGEPLGLSDEMQEDLPAIKKAFHQSILRTHPDKNHDDPRAADQTHLVIKAHLFFVQWEERKKYLKEEEVRFVERDDIIKEVLRKSSWSEILECL